MNLKQKTFFFVAMSIAALLTIYLVFSNYYVQQQERVLLDERYSTAQAVIAETALVDRTGEVFETSLIDCEKPQVIAEPGQPGDGPVLAVGDDLEWLLQAIRVAKPGFTFETNDGSVRGFEDANAQGAHRYSRTAE